jgi:hypothetical protein
VTVTDQTGTVNMALGKGEKGCIGLVEIAGNLQGPPYTYNGKAYRGEYNTKVIKAKLIPFDEIQLAYKAAKIDKAFNPRGSTGLQHLRDQKVIIFG